MPPQSPRDRAIAALLRPRKQYVQPKDPTIALFCGPSFSINWRHFQLRICKAYIDGRIGNLVFGMLLSRQGFDGIPRLQIRYKARFLVQWASTKSGPTFTIVKTSKPKL